MRHFKDVFDDPSKIFDDPQARVIFNRTYTRWEAALNLAKSIHNLPPNVLNLDTLLVRIPALPASIPSTLEEIEGFSTWVNKNTSDCNLQTRNDPAQTLYLRLSKYIKCSLSFEASFQVWRGSTNNGLALLFLAWAYILNANLAERQGLQLHHRPTTRPLASPPRRVSLAYATQQEVYWWKTITTPGTFCLSTKKILPWTVMLEDICSLEIAGTSGSKKTSEHMKLPSARTAATYLARLCAAYDLGDQSSAAFAAALCLPSRAVSNPNEKKITLPAVSLSSSAGLPTSYDKYPPHFKSLSHFMTLSLSTNTFKACLESVIWEPGITCNLGGAVLQAANQVLGPILQSQDYELLAKALSTTKAAPLWLGCSLCNWRYPLSVCLNSGNYFSRKSAEIAHWTGIPQSFFDLETQEPYLRKDGTVSRADVWRLRRDCSDYYINEDYREAPLEPWPPFGYMRSKDIDMELQSHLKCSHRWEYQYWTWLLPSPVKDEGYVGFYQPTPPVPLSLATSQENSMDEEDEETIDLISRHITERIFLWCPDQVEEGFTTTIVPPGWDNNEPPEQQDGGCLAFEAILRWRDEVQLN